MNSSPDGSAGFDPKKSTPESKAPTPPPEPPDSLGNVTGIDEIPFAQRLKKYRLFRKLSISELARRAKVAKSYVSMLEAGKRLPGRKAAWHLAKALEIPAEDFFLFMMYAHKAKSTEQSQGDKGVSHREYMQVAVLDAVLGGAGYSEKSFWGPNWGRRRLKAFTNQGLIPSGQPFTRGR